MSSFDAWRQVAEQRRVGLPEFRPNFGIASGTDHSSNRAFLRESLGLAHRKGAVSFDEFQSLRKELADAYELDETRKKIARKAAARTSKLAPGGRGAPVSRLGELNAEHRTRAAERAIQNRIIASSQGRYSMFGTGWHQQHAGVVKGALTTGAAYFGGEITHQDIEDVRQLETETYDPWAEAAEQASFDMGGHRPAFVQAREVLDRPGFTARTILQGAAISAPSFAAAAVAFYGIPAVAAWAGVSASGMAAATGAGLTVGGMTEYMMALPEAFEHAGVEWADKRAMAEALKNDELMSEVQWTAFKKAVPVALADAASIGLAPVIGRAVTRIPNRGLRGVTNFTAQTGVQAAAEGGGEALGQLWAYNKVNWDEAALEAIAGAGMGAPAQFLGDAYNTLYPDGYYGTKKPRMPRKPKKPDTPAAQPGGAVEGRPPITVRVEDSVISKKIDEANREAEKRAKAQATVEAAVATMDIAAKAERSDDIPAMVEALVAQAESVPDTDPTLAAKVLAKQIDQMAAKGEAPSHILVHPDTVARQAESGNGQLLAASGLSLAQLQQASQDQAFVQIPLAAIPGNRPLAEAIKAASREIKLSHAELTIAEVAQEREYVRARQNSLDAGDPEISERESQIQELSRTVESFGFNTADARVVAETMVQAWYAVAKATGRKHRLSDVLKIYSPDNEYILQGGTIRQDISYSVILGLATHLAGRRELAEKVADPTLDPTTKARLKSALDLTNAQIDALPADMRQDYEDAVAGGLDVLGLHERVVNQSGGEMFHRDRMEAVAVAILRGRFRRAWKTATDAQKDAAREIWGMVYSADIMQWDAHRTETSLSQIQELAKAVGADASLNELSLDTPQVFGVGGMFAYKGYRANPETDEFYTDDGGTLQVHPGSSVDTILHEFAHFMDNILEDGDLSGDLDPDVKAAWVAMHKRHVKESSDPIEQKEYFAEEFVAYVKTGKAADKNMRNLFAAMTRILARLVASLLFRKEIHTPEGIAFFDSLLAADVVARKRFYENRPPMESEREAASLGLTEEETARVVAEAQKTMNRYMHEALHGHDPAVTKEQHDENTETRVVADARAKEALEAAKRPGVASTAAPWKSAATIRQAFDAKDWVIVRPLAIFEDDVPGTLEQAAEILEAVFGASNVLYIGTLDGAVDGAPDRLAGGFVITGASKASFAASVKESPMMIEGVENPFENFAITDHTAATLDGDPGFGETGTDRTGQFMETETGSSLSLAKNKAGEISEGVWAFEQVLPEPVVPPEGATSAIGQAPAAQTEPAEKLTPEQAKKILNRPFGAEQDDGFEQGPAVRFQIPVGELSEEARAEAERLVANQVEEEKLLLDAQATRYVAKLSVQFIMNMYGSLGSDYNPYSEGHFAKQARKFRLLAEQAKARGIMSRIDVAALEREATRGTSGPVQPGSGNPASEFAMLHGASYAELLARAERFDRIHEKMVGAVQELKVIFKFWSKYRQGPLTRIDKEPFDFRYENLAYKLLVWHGYIPEPQPALTEETGMPTEPFYQRSRRRAWQLYNQGIKKYNDALASFETPPQPPVSPGRHLRGQDALDNYADALAERVASNEERAKNGEPLEFVPPQWFDPDYSAEHNLYPEEELPVDSLLNPRGDIDAMKARGVPLNTTLLPRKRLALDIPGPDEHSSKTRSGRHHPHVTPGTYSEVRNLYNFIRQLNFMATKTDQSVIDQRSRKAQALIQNMKMDAKKPRQDLNKLWAGVRDALDWTDSWMRIPEHLFFALDGFKVNGPIWTAIFKPLSDAQNQNNELLEEYSQKLEPLLKRMKKTKIWRDFTRRVATVQRPKVVSRDYEPAPGEEVVTENGRRYLKRGGEYVMTPTEVQAKDLTPAEKAANLQWRVVGRRRWIGGGTIGKRKYAKTDLSGDKASDQDKATHVPPRATDLEEVFMIALHSGTAHGRATLLNGSRRDEGMSKAFIHSVLELLGPDEWQLVQEIWDLMAELETKYNEVQTKVFGAAPPPVNPLRITYLGSDGKEVSILGKPFPVITHGEVVNPAIANEFERMRGWFNEHTPTKDHAGRPEKVDLGIDNGMLRAFQAKIHSITHLEPVSQVAELFDNKHGIRGAIIARTSDRHMAMLDEWLVRISKAPKEPMDVGTRVMKYLRASAATAIMAVNFRSAFQQFFGLFSAAQMVGGGTVGSGMATVIKRGVNIFGSDPHGTREWMVSVSPYMRGRTTTAHRDLEDQLKKLRTGKGVQWYMKHAWFLTRFFDMMTSSVIWYGVLDEAISNGDTLEMAVQKADSVVRMTQASARASDLSQMTSGNEYMRALTMFIGPLNAIFNLHLNGMRMAKQRSLAAGGTWTKAKQLRYISRSVFLLYLLPSLLTAAIFNDPDEDESTYMHILTTMLQSFMDPFPLVRDIGTAFGEHGSGVNPAPFDFVGSAARNISRVASGKLEWYDASYALLETLFYFTFGPAITTGRVKRAIEGYLENEYDGVEAISRGFGVRGAPKLGDMLEEVSDDIDDLVN